MLGDFIGIGGGLISTKLCEVKEIQKEIENRLALLRHSDENSRRQFEMFDALYRLICAVGGMHRLEGSDEEARK